MRVCSKICTFPSIGTGIHGAVVVLDPAFTADVMATALGIPNSKNIIRRHLTSELEALVQVPRFILKFSIMIIK